METGGNGVVGAAKMGGKEENPPVSIAVFRYEGVNKEVLSVHVLKEKTTKNSTNLTPTPINEKVFHKFSQGWEQN